MTKDLRTVAVATTARAAGGGLPPEHDRMLEVLEAHSRAERSADLEAVMATVADAPVWELAGRRFEGTDAVRRFYEAFIKHLPELAPLEYRTVVFGADVVATEFAWVVHTAGGDRTYPASCVSALDGDRLQAERIYCAPELAALVDGWLDE